MSEHPEAAPPAGTGRVWGPSDVLLAAALLTVCGAGIVARQVATGPAVAFTAAASFLAAIVAWWLAMSPRGLRIPDRWGVGLLVLALVGLAVANFLVPPEVDMRADRDDALDLAAAELLTGQDPWAVSTQIHWSHHPSPGAGGILLAAPFAIIVRDSSWQNVFWLALAGYLLVRFAGVGSAVAATALIVASPIFLNEWIYQSDLFTLALKLGIAMLWGLWSMRGQSSVAFALSAALFGVVLSDRFIFLSFALLLAVASMRWVPWRRSFAWLGIAAAVCVAFLAVPWILAPGYRTQVMLNVGKSSEAGDAIPQAGLILALLMLVAAAGLGLLVRDDVDLIGAAAVITALVVGWQILLYSLSAGTLSVDGTLAVAYTGVLLALGVGYLVLRRGTRGMRPT